ncbi:MAG: hypothetical protein J6Q76_08935 [Clostridia bacterium]|nr:hypothetical protein [Clostridia bacterium]
MNMCVGMEGYGALVVLPTVPNRCGKTAVLPTSQIATAIAPWQLLRRKIQIPQTSH